MYYVMQIKKEGVTGSNYVYGPFTKKEAEAEEEKRLGFYSNQYDVFIAKRLTHGEAVIE